jgi:hypothetical protein
MILCPSIFSCLALYSVYSTPMMPALVTPGLCNRIRLRHHSHPRHARWANCFAARSGAFLLLHDRIINPHMPMQGILNDDDIPPVCLHCFWLVLIISSITVICSAYPLLTYVYVLLCFLPSRALSRTVVHKSVISG